MQGTPLGKCWVSVQALAEIAAVEDVAREPSCRKLAAALAGSPKAATR